MVDQSNLSSSNSKDVIAYYEKTESRIGYDLLLHGTKHFGFYLPGQSKWQFGAAMLKMTDKLGETIGLAKGSFLLDAGCGVGDVARRLASTHGYLITGIDLLDFNIADAVKRAYSQTLSPMPSFSVMDYSKLTFDDSTFDGVYTMETLVHAKSPETVLEGFFRVLKPGGRIVLFEYSHLPYEQMPTRVASVFKEINCVAAMPAFDQFNYGTLTRMLKQTGFVDVECEDISKNIWPMLHAFSLMAMVPYQLSRLLNKTGKIPNAMSGVELWRYRNLWRYNVLSGRKPLQ